ncbi:Intradiol ring-cleavage dioxygenase [Xylariales sp. AK1849]|nr:Intradiol ring-cleavage dioxygenase [Xylariales sp. AK1849]
MQFLQLAFGLMTLASTAVAHPEKLSPEKAKREAGLAGRATGKCAAAIEARKEALVAKRSARLQVRRIEAGLLERSAIYERDELMYTSIQNDTCVLAPDTIFGPYGVDGEIIRHDLREASTGQEGFDLFLDIGVIDIETCEPLPQAALTIWGCNATGTYSGYTGIDPDTVEIMDGWTMRTDGTTDDETFLRGIQVTDDEGMAEFLTLFPGYYASRTTHVHVTVQSNITNGTGYSKSAIQHIGQIFFEEDLLTSVYELSPYSEHSETLTRVVNSEDSIYSVANADGYSAMISIEKIGASYAEGMVGYITIGVNTSAEALATTGTDVNVLGYLPTVSVATSKYAEATAVDVADGYAS